MNQNQEKVYIISDIEMGRGDVTDDFSGDDQVVSFIEALNIEATKQKTTFVLNGDVFDFLKMQYKGDYPSHITQEISLWKLEEVLRVHPKVFTALKKFLEHKNAHLFFVIGNHDFDLIWPALQERLKQTLQSEKIEFGYHYKKDGMRAEHGHMHDMFFSHNQQEPIVEHNGQKILNLPWGADVTFEHLAPFKRRFPEEERHSPKPMATKKFKKFAREAQIMSGAIAFKSLILDPLTRFRKPTGRVPHGKIFRHIMRHGFEFIDDRKFVKAYAQDVSQKNPDEKLIIIGHAHVPADMIHRAHRIIATDTWRDERNLENHGHQKIKTYAEILFKNGQVSSAELKEWI